MSENGLRAAIKAFAEASKQHYAYTLEGDHVKINMEADKQHAAYQIIRTHGEVGKNMLLELLNDPDLIVASDAASYCMHFAPEASKKVLKRTAKEKGMLGFLAKWALKRFDDDTWQQEIS